MGKRISEKRNALGLKRDALAEAAGISTKTVITAETGQKALRPENIVSLCHALDLDIGYLLTGKYSISAIFDEGRLKRLDAKQREGLKAMVDIYLSICIQEPW